MDWHAATRRLQRLARAAGMRLLRVHPHMLRHTSRHPGRSDLRAADVSHVGW
jgi:integrase